MFTLIIRMENKIEKTQLEDPGQKMIHPVWRQMAWTLLWAGFLVLQLTFSVAADVKVVPKNPVLHRQKRDWDFNMLLAYENLRDDDLPWKIGQLVNNRSSGNTEFKLHGEGVDQLFFVNENGEVFVMASLDREKKSEYHLIAEIRDAKTKEKLDRDAPFTVKVQDINDNAPVFSETFAGAINERSPKGTAVLTVHATDADDPTSPNGKVEYRLLNGTQYFSINRINGQINVLDNKLDREIQSQYKLIVQASDLPGLPGGNTTTTIVTINITDINDNMATFKEPKYHFNVNETEKTQSTINTLLVEDRDEKSNKNPKFEVDNDVFYMETDKEKNGALKLRKSLDYETTAFYSFKVVVTEDGLVQPPDNKASMLTTAVVLITVLDVDEPPVFGKTEYIFNIPEGPITKKTIGTVSARDPDKASYRIKYSIQGINCPVDIDENTGDLVLKGELDREETELHVCNVIAQEISPGSGGQTATAMVKIVVQDINDNKPELVKESDVYICENDQKGTIIGTIGASDRDLNSGPFRFHLAKKSSNFSLFDHLNSTASIVLTHGGFRTENLDDSVLEIEISDGGLPPQKSINQLRIRVCTCQTDRRTEYCRSYAQTGVSVSALIAILLCIVTILVIVILFVLRKRYQKETLVALGKSSGEIHEQLVTYDEEGGGEMDTNGYDVSILSSAFNSGSMRPTPAPAVYAVAKKPSACKGDMAMMIEVKKDEADHDRDGVPYDTLHIYGYEGSESLAGSLSSLDSSSTGSNLDYDFLSDWGPRFRTLAQLYGVDGSDSDSSY
ncbi:hypothetical protein NFI96_025991 [Prochilodus magdalenae]|nr:hypothetical protein NFI96_025991 [Prochilodus magdalenae]